MIVVSNVETIAPPRSLIEIDEYMPLRFRTYTASLGGARYIRIGNGETRLLELIVPSDSMVVRGFSIPLINSSAHEMMVGPDQSSLGLPVIDVTGQEFSETSNVQRLNTDIDFIVAVDRNAIDLSFDGAKIFTRSIQCGDVRFLIHKDILVGIRIANRSASEIQIFSAQLG